MQGGVEGGADLYHQPGVAHLLRNDDGGAINTNTNTGSGGVADADTQSSSNFYAAEKIGKRWQQQQHLDHQPAAANNSFVNRKSKALGSISTSSSGPGTKTNTDNLSSSNNSDHGRYNNDNNKAIVCYCLPCLAFGRGERGRSNVRLLSYLLVPIFLLSFFLMDDVYRVLQRNAQLHSALRSGDVSSAIIDTQIMATEVLRRKVVHEFPGIHREMLWIPLERTMTLIDPNNANSGSGSSAGEDTMMEVKAKLACPRGILFLFHGCGRYAASFFYSPQGRKMISMAIRSGVAVVTIKKNNEKACWDWENDGETVLKLGKKFLLSRVLDACADSDGIVENYPPIWGFGASSGGAFVSMLASTMAKDPSAYAPFLFTAINVQIMSPPEGVDWDIPTIFTVMLGDEITKSRVQTRVQTKLQSGIGGPFKMIHTSGQKGIHPDHFFRLYPEDKQMTGEVSRGIYQELVSLGLIDPNNNDMLTGDPRQMSEQVTALSTNYGMEARKAMMAENNNQEEVLPFGVSHQIMRPLQPDEQLDADNLWLTEELNVAWDMHEITAEGFDLVLDFFFEYGMHRIRNVTTT